MSATAPTPGVELAVNALSIRFGGLVAVENMTFEVRTGEVLSLIGPNGAGKTSAFNAITGYLRASSGEITYRGQRLNGLRPNRDRGMGVVRTFQKTSVFGAQSVLDNVLIGLHLRSRQRPIAIMFGLPSRCTRGRTGVCRSRAGIFCASSGSTHVRANRAPRCPMASCGCSRLRSRWQPDRSSSCSTSPSPG